MTDEERREAGLAYFKWSNPHAHKRRDDLAFDAGYAAACEAKREEMKLYDAALESAQVIADHFKAERTRSAKLLEAAKWSSSNRAPLIFADAPEHLAHFFKKLDQAIAEYEAIRAE